MVRHTFEGNELPHLQHNAAAAEHFIKFVIVGKVNMRLPNIPPIHFQMTQRYFFSQRKWLSSPTAEQKSKTLITLIQL